MTVKVDLSAALFTAEALSIAEILRGKGPAVVIHWIFSWYPNSQYLSRAHISRIYPTVLALAQIS